MQVWLAIGGAALGLLVLPLATFVLVKLVARRYRVDIAASTAAQVAPLLDAASLLSRMDTERLLDEIEQPLLISVDHITRDVMATRHPDVWESLPPLLQDMVIKQLQTTAPSIVARLVERLRVEVHAVLDLRQLATERLVGDNALLVRSVRVLWGPPNPIAMVASGALGAGLGLLAAALPPAGLPAVFAVIGVVCTVVAGATSIRLRSRRRATSREYARLFADEVFTLDRLADEMVRGRQAHWLYTLVMAAVDEAVANPSLLLAPSLRTMGADRVDALKRDAAGRAIERVPPLTRKARHYLTSVVDIATPLQDGLGGRLDATLLTAIRRGLWLLPAAGALTGALVGALLLLVV